MVFGHPISHPCEIGSVHRWKLDGREMSTTSVMYQLCPHGLCEALCGMFCGTIGALKRNRPECEHRSDLNNGAMIPGDQPTQCTQRAMTYPSYVTSVPLRYSAGDMESAGDNTDTTALLFPISIGPNCRSTVSAASSTWASSEPRQPMPRHAPACSTSACVSSRRDRSRAIRPIHACRWANSRTTHDRSLRKRR